MLNCPCTQSRRTFLGRAVGAALAVGLAGRVGSALAQQEPEITSETLARGTVGYSEFVDGPAEIVTPRILFPPGSFLPWHTHPGPVFGVVNSGQLTVYYDTAGCIRDFAAGEAVYVPRGTTHEEHNEGTDVLEVVSTFVVPVNTPLRLPAAVPDGIACE